MWQISNLSRPELQAEKKQQVKKIRQRAALASAAGVKSSRTTTKKAFTAANSGQGMIKGTWDQGLGIWTQHRKHNSTAKAPPGLCNKPASCKTEYLHAKTRSGEQPRGLTSANLLDCVILLPGSALPPFWSHKNPPPLLLVSFVSPRKCLSRVLPRCYQFLSGKIRRSMHTLVFRKEKLAFLFSCIKHIFHFVWGLPGRH